MSDCRAKQLLVGTNHWARRVFFNRACPEPSRAQDRLFAPPSFVSITYPVRRVGVAFRQPVQAAKNHSAKTNLDSPNGGNRAASSRSFFRALRPPSNGYEQSLELGFRLLVRTCSDCLVHQVSDWGSGAAANFDWMSDKAAGQKARSPEG
jgi:hypothetical protein